MSIYQRGTKLSKRLMKKFTQGAGALIIPGEPTGSPLNPMPGTPEEHAFDFTLIQGGALYRFKTDLFVPETDIMVTTSPIAATPKAGHLVTLNGDSYQVVDSTPATLDSDNPIVWRLTLRK